MSASPQRRKSPRNQTAMGTGRSVSALLRAVPKMEAPAPVPPRLRLRPTRKINPSLGRKSAPPQMVGLFFELKCTAGERALRPFDKSPTRDQFRQTTSCSPCAGRSSHQPSLEQQEEFMTVDTVSTSLITVERQLPSGVSPPASTTGSTPASRRSASRSRAPARLAHVAARHFERGPL